MAANGYDEFQPVMLATWPGQKERVIIDGHTRLKASLNLGITKDLISSTENLRTKWRPSNMR